MASSATNSVELEALHHTSGTQNNDTDQHQTTSRAGSRRSSVSRLSVDSTHSTHSSTGHHAPSHAVPQTTSVNARPPSASSSSTPKPAPPVQSSHGPAWKISWWWWWELGAALLSMASIFSIIIILATYEDRPLTDWTFNIQINSLISTLTTIGKTAMLVAVAESISQLKWLHFYQQSRPLDRFQDFDDASRGPWGSATLLWTTNVKAILASLGAIITICGLAIEPMAQQVLDFPSRNVTLTNATASIGIADSYYSRAFQGSGDSSGDLDITGVVGASTALLALQSSLINGIVGTIANVNMSCPLEAARCEFPAFTTMGMCGSWRNITNYERNCTDYNPTLICDYTSPDFPDFSNLRSDQPEAPNVVRMQYDTHNTPQNNLTHLFATYLNRDQQGLIAVTAKEKVRRDEVGTHAPPVDIEEIHWDLCIRDYEQVVASGNTITQNSFTSELASFDRHQVVTDEDGTNTPYQVYKGNVTGRTVMISANTNTNLWGNIVNPLNTTLVGQDSRWQNTHPGELDYGNYLYMADLRQVVADVADTMTNNMRSTNLDGEAATLLQGSVFYSETYIEVRWLWLILPLAETILATVLLLSSIVISTRGPLWKSSAIAPYLHPLKGWDETDLMVKGYESSGAMERLVKGMTAALDKDADGRLRMLRR